MNMIGKITIPHLLVAFEHQTLDAANQAQVLYMMEW